MYRPKVITGKVTGTNYPIDGRALYFSMWDYDRENWHLYGWDDDADEDVMATMYLCEAEDGLFIPCEESLAEFTKRWKAKEWDPMGPFCLPLDNVEVEEILQEEQKNDARERLLFHGYDLSPRTASDRGGIICLPMEKNLNGDVKAKHPDWELISCPGCGRKCWKQPAADKLAKEQGVQLLCTECAIEAELVAPYRPSNTPNPRGNRAQRRRTKQK